MLTKTQENYFPAPLPHQENTQASLKSATIINSILRNHKFQLLSCEKRATSRKEVFNHQSQDFPAVRIVCKPLWNDAQKQMCFLWVCGHSNLKSILANGRYLIGQKEPLPIVTSATPEDHCHQRLCHLLLVGEHLLLCSVYYKRVEVPGSGDAHL